MGDPDPAVGAAIAWLKSGGIVAFPTDTVYGLAVDPRSRDAVDALFDLKGRDPRLAVPLLGASREQVEVCCGVLTGATARLADAFWPGPLSLILDAPPAIDPRALGGLQTAAVRVPAQSLARALAAGLDYLVTATSANKSGAPAATRAGELGDVGSDTRVFVLDDHSAGAERGRAPSTIVDARSMPPTLVRAGAIAWSRVLESLHG